MRPAVQSLVRLGYDNIRGYLAGGMLSWLKAGRETVSVRTESAPAFCRYIDENRDVWVLDVRSDDELKEGAIAGARHIHVTQIPARIDEVPRGRAIAVLCGSGLRSMTAASILQQHGWTDVIVILGGTSGWNSARCPLIRGREAAPAQ
jgi:hydroxyacylglutathione hydrolase